MFNASYQSKPLIKSYADSCYVTSAVTTCIQ